MSEEIDTYTHPFYLFRSSELCWKCHAPCQVVALASGGGEPFVLSDIRSLPEEILLSMTAAQPNYELRCSQTTGSEYLMNTCPCGAHFGDYFLYSKPGGAFFPTAEDEAAQIELPLQGSFEIDCSPGMGLGGFILQYGKRLSWDSIE